MSTETTDANTETSSLLSWQTWDRIKHTEWFVLVATIVFVSVFPWVFTSAPFVPSELLGYNSLVRRILIWGIFALGFNLLLGQTGMLSFGHAMFFGGAAYAAALFANHVVADPFLAVVAGVLFAVVLAAVTAFPLLRLHTVYFSIVTLAIAQMLFYLAREPLGELTGGINGLGVEREELFGVVDLNEQLTGIAGTLWMDHMYLFIAAFFIAVVAFITRVRKSPYGLILKAIRENGTRASFVGLNVWRYKYAAFVLSGFVAGIAGGLMPMETMFTGVNRLHWTTSGDIVMMTVLGGLGTIVGPILGVSVFVYFEGVVNGLDQIGGYWLLTLALAFTAVVWKYPDGLWGMVTDASDQVRSQRGDR
ncbi:branched-chain amino acid ABC transporter permease [Halomicrobium salinisoli]|uniref:branched-chain amino acid ABC transporter permease n=1 Tax=Halomicrobium salinisoli TaxID=2878391 RepID=UPI001CF0A2B5|nr:branched-chain amino acid ABC transporter permease [Halomicrobium salinisoli]